MSNPSELFQIDADRGIFRVARRCFTDRELFAQEQKKIFNTCWLYVGHESEVREPRSFQTRLVGGREIIFNRDSNGVVNAFFNSCPHRGGKICPERSGKSGTFYCAYHGWSFRSSGEVLKIPGRNDYHPTYNDDGSANMVKVPRLENYRGIYFLNYDPNAIPLSDYLGRAKEFLDNQLDQFDEPEIVQGTQEYAIKANWKVLAENSVDGNHGDYLHSTFFEYARNIMPPELKGKAKGANNFVGTSVDLGNGHAVLNFEMILGRASGIWSPLWGEEVKPEIEANYQKIVARMGEERAWELVRKSRNLLIFPNLMLVDSTGLTFRSFNPDSEGFMQVSSNCMVDRNESPGVRKVRLNAFIEFLGAGGFGTTDDVEVMEQLQRSYEANGDSMPWNDMSKGPLGATGGSFDIEVPLRAFWIEWAKRMGVAMDPAGMPNISEAAE